ncbi:MAG TPA: hypothetical protein PK867_29435 [Pirellulales bacterium]|nr:hypothetical protein [Pirellulales bacterium]
MTWPDTLRQSGATADGSRAGQRGELSRRTRGEHDDLLAAMHQLEAALASPAPGRAEAWAKRVGRDLRLMREHLRSHVASAETADGLCSELKAARPEMTHRIEQLQTEHGHLLDSAAALADSLHPTETAAAFAAVRQQAAELLELIRAHHAKEVALIYECFCTDIGVGD